jgi:hypothetical protein
MVCAKDCSDKARTLMHTHTKKRGSENMKKRKSSRHKALLHTSFRLSHVDHKRLIEAATKLEITVAQMIRSAVREKTTRILDVSNAQRERGVF